MDELLKYMQSRDPGPFSPSAYYSPEGDTVEVYWKDANFYARSVSGLDVHFEDGTEEIIGVTLHQVRKKVEERKAMRAIDFARALSEVRNAQPLTPDPNNPDFIYWFYSGRQDQIVVSLADDDGFAKPINESLSLVYNDVNSLTGVVINNASKLIGLDP